MFSGVPNGPLRLSPPQVHAAVHNSGDTYKPVRQTVIRYLTRTTLADLAGELEHKQKAVARRKARKKSSRKAGR